jgi:hypothetical protein
MPELLLTPEQCLTLNLPEESEVQFNGGLVCAMEIIGAEKVYDFTIEWLEIKVGSRWIALFDQETELKAAPIRLTEEQYSEVIEILKNKSYD